MADDKSFNDEVDEYNQTLQESMQLSLKDHLDKLEAIVKNILGDLEHSKQEIVIIKKDFLEFDAAYHNNNKNFAGMIEKRMSLLNQDFDRMIKESRSDLSFLRSQLEKVVDEADVLADLSEQLEKKVYRNEEFIGFGHLPEDEPLPADGLEETSRAGQTS